MQACRSSRQTGGRTPPVGATPTIAVVGRRAERVGDAGDDRDALVARAGALGVEDRDGRVGRVADDAAHRLPVVRVSRVTLGEDQVALHGAPRAGHAEARAVGGELDAVDERDAGPRVVGEQEVAVEVDVVAEAGRPGSRRLCRARTRSCSRS